MAVSKKKLLEYWWQAYITALPLCPRTSHPDLWAAARADAALRRLEQAYVHIESGTAYPDLTGVIPADALDDDEEDSALPSIRCSTL